MMVLDDLHRAGVRSAGGVYILSDRFCTDTNQEDYTTILRALAVRNVAPTILTYVELIEPENRRHLLAVQAADPLPVYPV